MSYSNVNQTLTVLKLYTSFFQKHSDVFVCLRHFTGVNIQIGVHISVKFVELPLNRLMVGGSADFSSSLKQHGGIEHRLRSVTKKCLNVGSDKLK